MSAEDLGKISDGIKVAALLPYLERELDGMEAAVNNRVFQEIDAGELTPEMAIAAWIEVRVLRRLMKRLVTHVKIGQSAGQRAAPELNA